MVAVFLVWLWREPLQQLIAEKATLANDAPSQEVVQDMIEHAIDPRAALLEAWNSGKIMHRAVAIRSLSTLVRAGQALPSDLDSILISAALDPDMDVREAALTTLQQREHPALPALAAEQLKDVDQQVRLLGLDHLRTVEPAIGVQTVMPLLDDEDPMIVTTALKLLEKWTGQQFGVKLSDTAAFENEKTGLKEYREGSFEKAKAGAQRAKTWWLAHQTEFPPVSLQVPKEGYKARRPVPAADFELRTLAGQKLRLSDFRGKVVLVNFWTTWCPACLSEMPELLALQRQHQTSLVILGVSLDYVPDEHGHIGGHPAVEEQGIGGGEPDKHEARAAELRKVREKVARTVQARGINYPILLDEKNEAGGRYNGGELPTTVIVDAQGNVRRRFVGARSWPVFEAMLAEAARPRVPAAE
jgi:thiol-disulfide isomerase/thioredoxin